MDDARPPFPFGGPGLRPAALQSQSGWKPVATVRLPERFRASCAFGGRYDRRSPAAARDWAL